MRRDDSRSGLHPPLTNIPTTVTTALDDRPVRSVVYLEAGVGTGNVTAGLFDAGAKQARAVTNDPERVTVVRGRVTLPSAG